MLENYTKLDTEYSKNWHDLGTTIIYKHSSFVFNNNVLLLDFENCLIKKMSNPQLYHSIDPKSIILYNEDFFNKIYKERNMYSIVIISNVSDAGKLAIDSLKLKLELFLNKYDLPLLAFFATKKNRWSKPYTGQWNLINGYFKKYDVIIKRACIVSDNGGRILEKELKTGIIKTKADNTDFDRAFAHNIEIPYYTINEYLDINKKEKFNWNSICLSPDKREKYIETLKLYNNPNLFAKLEELSKLDRFMIIIYGAPRAGKTTVANELLSFWNKVYGHSRVLKRLGLEKNSKIKRINDTKKALNNRINVIIDGGTHTTMLREPYEKIANEYKTPITYIEINPGFGMAYLFNHVTVETANDEDIEIYNLREYFYYKSTLQKPDNTISYCPIIKKTKQIMKFRY